MAGSSSSISHSESQSDTYIPEYSQTPILMEIAQHARSMADTVYNWGMDQYNRQEGDIDSLMRDALSYASPQRIAVDMGMAEAGVMQAGERGRLSAIRDLESYGIDPSSGRYAALDKANRVMTAAAGAGAGNQQRMASQAAGNAMRNQALAAGLQNAQFGLGVGNSANQFLNTASQLKYPPLGRQSTSVSDSKSESVQTDPGGGGSKGGDKPPAQQQAKDGGGGKEPKPPAAPKPVKPPPKATKPPAKPGEKTEPEDPWLQDREPFYNPLGTDPAEQPFQTATDPTGQISGITPEMQDPNNPYSQWGISNDPNNPLPGTAPAQDWPTPNPDPFGQNMPVEDTPPNTQPGGTASTGYNMPTEDTPPDTQPGGAAYPGPETPSGMDMEFNPWGGQMGGPGGDTLVDSGYNPYSENIQTAAFDPQQAIDPDTGLPVEPTEVTDGGDPAGSLYSLDPGGDWTLDVGQPATETVDWTNADDTFAGDGTLEFGADQPEGQVYDAAYDSWTDEADGGQLELTDFNDPYTDQVTDAGGDEYGNFEYDFGDTGDYDFGDYDYGDIDYGDYDFGDDSWTDDYADTDWGDYADDSYEYDFGDESWEDYAGDEYDFGDDSYEDYTDDEYDYGDDTDDWTDGGGDDSWDDSGDETYDYGDDTSSWTDGGDYARGGPVRRGGPMRRPQRRPPPTGYRPRPARPPQQTNGQLQGWRPPPRPPGATRLTPPPQAPRPQRGAPMAPPGGPRPPPMGRGMGGPGGMTPGNFISANGMPPPASGGMPRPQRMAGGGAAGRRPEPTQGGFVSRELSPSNGSKVDDVQARLNAGEFVIPKDVATWKGKEFFYKMIAQARKLRSGGNEKPQMGYGGSGSPPTRGMR